MSFLYILNKTTNKVIVDTKALSHLICPYDVDVEIYSNKQHALYFNDLSEFKNHKLKTPKNHKSEPQAAWLNIDLVDHQTVFETDPMGQVPLWYVENEKFIAVTSEQKSFRSIKDFKFDTKKDADYLEVKARHRIEFDFKNISRVSPGSRLVISALKFEISCQTHQMPWDQDHEKTDMTTAEAQDLLYSALLKSASTIPTDHAAAFLSGGIDSSVATALCPQADMAYNLKTSIGSEEAESKETAKFLKRESETIIFNQQNIIQYFSEAVFCNEIYDGLTAEIILQMISLIQNVPNHKANFISGYGADLLFGGMLGHKEYLYVTGVKDTQSLLNRTYWSKEMSPFYYWKERKRMFHLYWHPEVIQAALKIPLILQQQVAGTEKYILRSLAVRFNLLTQPLAFRTKTGMTNGTQMHVLLSQALQLPNEYSFDLKTKIALEKFHQLFSNKT